MKCFRCLSSEVRRVLFCRDCRDKLRTAQMDLRRLTSRIRKGVQLAGAGQLTQSAVEFQKALETDGENRGAFESLMVLYGSLNQLDHAASLVRQYPFEDPLHRDPLLQVAQFYHQRRFNALAEIAIQRSMNAAETAEGHILLGRIYREQENWSKSAAAFRRALKLQPASAPIHCDLGTALLKLGQTDKARTHIARAIALEPDNATHHFYMATVHEARGDLLRASKEMRVAASLNREFLFPSIDLAFQLVVNRLRDGDLKVATQEWERCTRDNSEVFHPAFLEECQQFLGRVITGQHLHTLLSQYPTLRFMDVKGLQKLQRIFSDTPRLVFCLGLAHHWFDTTKESRQTYRAFPSVPLDFVFEEWMDLHAALSHDELLKRPLAPLEIYELLIGATGHMLSELRSLMVANHLQPADSADDDLDEMDSSETEVPLDRALGTTLWAVSLESYLLTEAIRRCREYPEEFYSHFHAARWHRENRNYTRAISEFESAVQLLPRNAALRNMLWNLHIREERFGEAMRHCRETLAFSQHRLYRAAACNDMAYCLVEVGAPLEDVLVLTERARELAPMVFDHHIDETRAWGLYRDGHFDEALALMEKVLAAMKGEPPSSVHYYHYGKILLAMGRRELARQAFNTALQIETRPDADWGVTRKVKTELEHWSADTK